MQFDWKLTVYFYGWKFAEANWSQYKSTWMVSLNWFHITMRMNFYFKFYWIERKICPHFIFVSWQIGCNNFTASQRLISTHEITKHMRLLSENKRCIEKDENTLRFDFKIYNFVCVCLSVSAVCFVIIESALLTQIKNQTWQTIGRAISMVNGKTESHQKICANLYRSRIRCGNSERDTMASDVAD